MIPEGLLGGGDLGWVVSGGNGGITATATSLATDSVMVVSTWERYVAAKERKRILLRNKVELDAHLRELVHVAVLALLIEAQLSLIVGRVVLDLNVAVVLNTAADGRPDGGGAFDLAKAVCWGQ